MILALALTACKTDATPTAAEPEPLGPYIDPWEPVDISWDRNDVEAGLQAAVDTVVGLDSTPVFAAYDDVMGLASPICPMMEYDFEGSSAWFDSCATDSGTQYSGYAYAESAEFDGVLFSALSMSATIAGVGQAFSGSGYWADSFFDDGTVSFWGSYLEGQVLLEGGGAPSWIRDGIRPAVEIERSRFVGLPRTFVVVNGAVGGLDAAMETADFLAVEMVDPECDEPIGTISVRNAEGNWFDVRFDGETCDGCGTASHLGEELGEVCVSFDAWMNWEAP